MSVFDEDVIVIDKDMDAEINRRDALEFMDRVIRDCDKILAQVMKARSQINRQKEEKSANNNSN